MGGVAREETKPAVADTGLPYRMNDIARESQCRSVGSRRACMKCCRLRPGQSAIA